jgi:hypothetical protein
LATVPATGQPDFGSSLPLLNYDEPVQRVMNKRHALKPIVYFVALYLMSRYRAE